MAPVKRSCEVAVVRRSIGRRPSELQFSPERFLIRLRTAALVAGLASAAAGALAAQAAPYRALVGAESDDLVELIEFRPCAPQAPAAACGAKLARSYAVGLWPAEIEGPHGVAAAPDGKSFYVSMAHGRPFGLLLKYDLASGALLGKTELGMFPATLDIDPRDSIVYAINFNFEDPQMKPSSLSVIDGAMMMELARPTTCRMPHGSRLSPDGAHHYSGCMMNDLLVEVDARTFEVTRLLNLAPGKEGPVDIAKLGGGMAGMSGSHQAMDHGDHTDLTPSSTCSPTWAQPSADGKTVYAACNKSNDVVAVDVASWTVTKRFPTPAAPYNMAVSPNGKFLVITQKGPGTITVWSLPDAKLLGEIKGTRGIASGVVVTADSKYAFATLEGKNAQPGTVDIIDLTTVTKVASVDIGKQAGGIALLP